MMRRKEKEITEKAEIEQILRGAMVCRLAMSVDDQPYMVPLCFGYKDGNLYSHCAREGMKLEFLEKNNKVCFECDMGHEVVRSDRPCEWGMKGLSVIGFGRAHLLDTPEAKREALGLIMEHYGGKRTLPLQREGV